MIINQSSILVTGGAGFIGSHLTERLLEMEAQVTVVDNLATGRLDNLQTLKPIKLAIGDLGDLLRTEQINLADYHYVFHLAANPYIPPSVENSGLTRTVRSTSC